MKYTVFALILISLFASCQQEESPVTQSASLVGTWQVSKTVGLFYTDHTLMDKQVQTGSSTETYHFFANGTFELRQGDDMFLVHGRWQLNTNTNQLTLLTAGGETLHWTVDQIASKRLVLSYVQKIPFNEHTQRLEVTTTCTRN